MQRSRNNETAYPVVISFQFSTFVSLMQPSTRIQLEEFVVISFQFSTFVSLMQPGIVELEPLSLL